MTIEVTEDHKEVIDRMARKGMTIKMVAAAVGMCERNFYRKPELLRIYHKAHRESIEKVGAAIFKRALEKDDITAQIYILKTQAGWSEHSYVSLDDFAGKTHAEKQQQIDEMLEAGELSVENYKHLAKSLGEQYQVAEHETRLRVLEAAIKPTNDPVVSEIVKIEDEGETDGETNNEEAQGNPGE